MAGGVRAAPLSFPPHYILKESPSITLFHSHANPVPHQSRLSGRKTQLLMDASPTPEAQSPQPRRSHEKPPRPARPRSRHCRKSSKRLKSGGNTNGPEAKHPSERSTGGSSGGRIPKSPRKGQMQELPKACHTRSDELRRMRGEAPDFSQGLRRQATRPSEAGQAAFPSR